ncbi:thioesterase II family protein [Streptomyces sp. NPDC087440]|uniref:thioesterase II family protein n=1 Tax=Streptomyces sp. NPDC087440 TaxID=3365790 RepID=UPI0037FA8CEA
MTPLPLSDRGWLRSLNQSDRPAHRLVCFPHSGGTASVYRAWSAALPADGELLGVQYPGRLERMDEEPADSVAQMAACVAADLLRRAPLPCFLFGHSLGALVAYETALLLEAAGHPVDTLVVSGAPAPWLAGGGSTHRLPDDELWDLLGELGGIDPRLGDDRELRALLLPVLRADIRLNETYRASPHAEPLTCTLRALHHTGDPLVDAARTGAWARATTGAFGLRSGPGGHFDLPADVGALAEALSGAPTEVLPDTLSDALPDTLSVERPRSEAVR